MKLLLVAYDELEGRETLTGLELQGYAVDWLPDEIAAELAVRSRHYDAVLLDIDLSGQKDSSVLRNLRRAGFKGAILIVTARNDLPNTVDGLDDDADDFIVKPFDLNELGARVQSAHRRASNRVGPVHTMGDLLVDQAARQVLRRGVPVALTAREFGLLLYLLEHSGQVRTREQLQETDGNREGDRDSNAIEVHIHNLRRKLGREVIRTVHGQGYVIDRLPAK